MHDPALCLRSMVFVRMHHASYVHSPTRNDVKHDDDDAHLAVVVGDIVGFAVDIRHTHTYNM